MSHFIYHDLGRIEYEKALERQTAAFNALLEAKAQGRDRGKPVVLLRTSAGTDY